MEITVHEGLGQVRTAKNKTKWSTINVLQQVIEITVHLGLVNSNNKITDVSSINYSSSMKTTFVA